MSTKRFRLTKAAKILIAIIVMALIGGGVYFVLKKCSTWLTIAVDVN